MMELTHWARIEQTKL